MVTLDDLFEQHGMFGAKQAIGPLKTGRRHGLVWTLAILGAVAFLAQESAAQGFWTLTGSMAFARRDHTATLLTNGKVLIVGGFTDKAELFDPGTGTFGVIGATVSAHGQFSTATRLHDGRVLIAGGSWAPQAAEIYDPAAGTFSATGILNVPHIAHTATLLLNGSVLIAAGQDPAPDQRTTHATAELYDPLTGTFSLTGSLIADRELHSATLLPDGKVLVVGGDHITSPGWGQAVYSAELYDPTGGTFSSAGNIARCNDSGLWWTQLAVLTSGKVLVVAGASLACPPSPPSAPEVFDPSTGTFMATGSLAANQMSPSASLLPNGQVLVAGGYGSGTFGLSLAQLYDAATNTFAATASMNQGRQQHTATLLQNGQVLVTGGYNSQVSADLSSAELFSVLPAIVTVPIDIKPGSFPNSINPNSKGVIPVGILTTATFNAATVDSSTVRFGRTGTAASPVHISLEDVNRDGLIDMVLHFNTEQTGIVCGTTSASLTGKTLSGQSIKGSDSVSTVGCR